MGFCPVSRILNPESCILDVCKTSSPFASCAEFLLGLFAELVRSLVYRQKNLFNGLALRTPGRCDHGLTFVGVHEPARFQQPGLIALGNRQKTVFVRVN